MTDIHKRTTNEDVMRAIEALGKRVEALEAHLNDPRPDMRRMAKEAVADALQEATSKLQTLFDRNDSAVRAQVDTLARLLNQITALEKRIAAVEAAEREHGAISRATESHLSMIVKLVEGRDAQLAEHGRDIDEMQRAIAGLQSEAETSRDDIRDLGQRIGYALMPLTGYNPAASDSTRQFPNMIDRVSTIENSMSDLRAQMRANADALQAIQRQLAAIGEFAQRVVPPRVRKLIFNVTFLRLLLIIGGGLLGVNLFELLNIQP